MIFVTSKFAVCIVLFTTMPLGTALGIPVLQVFTWNFEQIFTPDTWTTHTLQPMSVDRLR